MTTKTTYLASGWFNEPQLKLFNEARKALEQNETINLDDSFIPYDHSYKGWTPENKENMFGDNEWQMGQFRADITGIRGTDITIALIDPRPEFLDSGVVWEMGYAAGKDIPVYLVLPDDATESVNLMPSAGSIQTLTVSQLQDFNFNQAWFKPSNGQVF